MLHGYVRSKEKKADGSILRRNWLENLTRKVLNTIWSAGWMWDVRSSWKKLWSTEKIGWHKSNCFCCKRHCCRFCNPMQLQEARPQKPSDRYSDLSHFSIVKPRQFVRGRVHRSSKLLSSLRRCFLLLFAQVDWLAIEKCGMEETREKKNK